ncbi:MAG: hypothetical protein LBJ74_05880 [Heliobacteriaceae bacterium]|jgi:hypothetical protein|nr:hypothetical protein [Heliobacteriaceae bacterium]
MKKIALTLLTILFSPLCFAEENLTLPNIFIWTVPDNVQEAGDTDEIMLEPDAERLNAAALKGYAEYKESAVYLNVKAPKKLDIKQPTLSEKIALKMQPNRSTARPSLSDEYSIVSSMNKLERKTGSLSYGTTYSSIVDTDSSQLERTTELFTRYDFKRFALSSSFQKTLGTTSGKTSDIVYLIPEWKINSVFSVQDVIKSNMTSNSRSNEVVLVVKPFKDRDKLNFELGAGQTYYENSGVTRSKVRFSTKIKL